MEAAGGCPIECKQSDPPPVSPQANMEPVAGSSYYGSVDIKVEFSNDPCSSAAPDKPESGVVKPERPEVPMQEESHRKEASGHQFSKIMCKDFARGRCFRRECKFNHKLDLSQLHGVYQFCRDFQKKGCTFRQCKFVHATEDEESQFYRTGVFPPHINERLMRMKTPPRPRRPPPEEPPNTIPAMCIMPPPPPPPPARPNRPVARIGVRAFARLPRPYYHRQRMQRPLQPGRSMLEDEEVRPVQKSMCEDCVQYMLRVHLPQQEPNDMSEAAVREELSGMRCLERVHALIMIVLQLKSAGCDVSELPDDPVLMQEWLTFNLNNGLNPMVVYRIQKAVDEKYPDCELNVPNLIARWLNADLEDTLTYKFYGCKSHEDTEADE